MSDSDRRFQRKLAAFLQDPIDKPLLPMQTEERHKDRAERLREQLGLHDLEAKRPASDHFASAMERAFVPGEAAISFLEEPEVRHPFSGAPYPDIDALAELDPSRATEEVETALERLGPLEADENPQRSFFALWRTLIPVLRAHGPEALSKYWSVLPADTCIPDHSLFQHLTVASAFSGLNYEDAGLSTDATFLLVTIGPAQGFIQQSRKTQDLYWGSALLSHVAWAAMKPVVERHGPDAVLFPDLYGQPLVDQWLEEEFELDLRGDSRSDQTDLPTLPNRFFAVVETESEDARAELLETVETAVYNRLDEVAEAVVGSNVIPGDKKEDVPRAAVETHLRDALSIYGVALPFHSVDDPLTPEGVLDAVGPHVDENTTEAVQRLLSVAEGEHTQNGASPGHVYSLLHTVTEKMLAAQKNTRAFAPLPANEKGRAHGERGRKCGLCGERNALFYRGDPAQIRHNEQAICVDGAPKLNPAQMRDGEGLCGSCFVKRFAREELGGQDGFPSTTEVALAPLRNRFQGRFDQIERALCEAIGEEGTFDDQLFFEENLRPGYLAEYVYPQKEETGDRDFLDEKVEALRTAHEKHLKNGLAQQMSKYYGLLVLDGDNMGKWVAGEKAPPIGREDEGELEYSGIYHSDVWNRLPSDLRDSLEDLPPQKREYGRRPLTPALHAALSRALVDYALEAVRPIVEEKHNGRLVYAGGDDVLAFVPLAEALDTTIHLRAAFSGHRDAEGDVDFEAGSSGFVGREGRIATTMGPTASASAGLALAHYKTPLSEVLAAARAMEKQAKEAGPLYTHRDRLAIAVLKRSGERTEGLIPFRGDGVDGAKGLVSIFQDLIGDLQDESLGLSPTFIRTLRREIQPLLHEKGSFGDELENGDELLRSETARLLRRSLDASDPEQADDFVAETVNRLMVAYDEMATPENFLDVLDVTLFLYRETESTDVR